MLDKNVKKLDDYQVSRIKHQVSCPWWKNSLQFVLELETPKSFSNAVYTLRLVPCPALVPFRLHERKKNNLPDRIRIGKQHGKPVYPNPLAGSRRHSVFQRFNVVLVH